jgi:hypothetical protein
LVHSQRITSKSWTSAVELLRSSFTWTGDLGTESFISTCHINIKHLFGEWIQQADEDTRTREEGGDSDADSDCVEPAGPAIDENADSPPDGDVVFDCVEPARPAIKEIIDFDFDIRSHADSRHSEEAPDPADVADPYDIDFRRAVFIAGILHVVHNMTKDIDKANLGMVIIIIGNSPTFNTCLSKLCLCLLAWCRSLYFIISFHSNKNAT